ncbi:hypothetical protein RHGRI_029539 [Rhododendron griersonianum]|uniref:Uncharacterized protein n=1 Tax=Rhododendron griersonianum TaxID=479676 RepID=A0AAV6IJQ1_9ERIC|nr:hypothetical protein RHGRI_029539 [Rhododendron griersonianum]
MAAQAYKRGGQRPHIADFYSSSHYNQKKKKWVAPICEQLHLLLEARQKEDEARCQEADALGLPITMPQEEMPIEVLGKKFYVKEYGVSLKSSSSKRSSGQSHEEVRVLKNEVETLNDVCKQQNDQVETLKDLCQTQKETIQMQQEKINAYDEKFASFEAVMSAYMHGNPIGVGSHCHVHAIKCGFEKLKCSEKGAIALTCLVNCSYTCNAPLEELVDGGLMVCKVLKDIILARIDLTFYFSEKVN